MMRRAILITIPCEAFPCEAPYANLTVLPRYLRPSFAVFSYETARDAAMSSLASDVDARRSRVVNEAVVEREACAQRGDDTTAARTRHFALVERRL